MLIFNKIKLKFKRKKNKINNIVAGFIIIKKFFFFLLLSLFLYLILFQFNSIKF